MLLAPHMLTADPVALLRRLSPRATQALHGALGLCVARRQYELTVEHLLLGLLDDVNGDVPALLRHYGVEPAPLVASLQRYTASLRAGNPGKPVFSPRLLEWVEDAWVVASVEFEARTVRGGALFTSLLAAPERYSPAELAGLEAIPREALRREWLTVAAGTSEAQEEPSTPLSAGPSAAAPGAAEAGGRADGALARFTTDLTARARAGEIDPVLGRESEIRQVVDVLVRRRKNNPLIVGEAGVGKTALVEGLANRIAEGSVPESLREVRILSLDLGALQAGAGVKGEFEKRLKGVIDEVKASATPIVLFIDEAHTLIGAGGPQGGGDAANLLKPALARGELRTIAATTWSEFKRYFEKDAALERRFQPVKVDEPSVELAIRMLRGLARRFEQAHGVIIRDEAVRAAVELSSRYMAGRQLPDKAVDLLDTSAARVKIARAAPPAALEDARAALTAVEVELAAYQRDRDAGLASDAVAEAESEARRTQLATDIAAQETRLADQRARVARIDELRAPSVTAEGEEARAKQDELRAELAELGAIGAEERVVHADVDEALVASVVADFTGIPVGKMVQDDLRALLELEQHLTTRVRGQAAALSTIARELRAARSGLKPTSTPLGVFLLVGPSGVGKTETALTLAERLFGGERFLITINMSEFQERHTVSRLIGSPPGYVGYGEGGMLTEAVRQRPYSVVLLDEVEKADREVLNLFYQVFDKGTLTDGEGRTIDFTNTVIVLTSNLATDLLTTLAAPGAERPSSEQLIEQIRPTLVAHFKPALLARMTVVPYVPIGAGALVEIVTMKLAALAARARASHRLDLTFEPGVVEAIAARCREVDSGARNVDHILRGTLLPRLSNAILERLASGESLDHLHVRLDEAGELVCAPRPTALGADTSSSSL